MRLPGTASDSSVPVAQMRMQAQTGGFPEDSDSGATTGAAGLARTSFPGFSDTARTVSASGAAGVAAAPTGLPPAVSNVASEVVRGFKSFAAPDVASTGTGLAGAKADGATTLTGPAPVVNIAEQERRRQQQQQRQQQNRVAANS